MVHFLAVALAFSSLLVGSQVSAAPMHEIAARQIGNVQCNVDRLSIVAGLAKTQKTLKTIATSSDDSTASSVQSVIDSISGAQGAIGVIAKALLTGETAPADARTQVKDNLVAATETLSGITSTDATTAADLKKAQTELASAAKAGEGVVANCN